MFRSVDDFLCVWSQETDATLKIFRALTEPSLSQVVRHGGRSLGRLAWHITTTIAEMGKHAGLDMSGPSDETPPPPLPQLVTQYEALARALGPIVQHHWTDAMLAERIPMYGESWTRGETLLALIVHQAHHRGQMTVLMRQAGLKVPGIYGPAAEEWAAMGMPAHA